MSTRTCANQFCQTQFEVTEADGRFYKKMDVPEPDICFDCRQREKLAFRNERKLYHNVCKLCNKTMISIYSPDKPYTVYCTGCWWRDAWNPLNYGREYDFNRPFFDQIKDLWDEVPKLCLLALGDNQNSDYSHDAYRLLNSYLIFDGEQAKDCYYGETFSNLKDCCDFLFVQRCELCYEVINCNDCYNVNYSRYCYNCSDSNFLLNCYGCRNCFGCVNLKQKQYHILNKPYSQEEYEKFMKSIELGDYSALQKMKVDFENFIKKFPQKYIHGIMNENVSGENLNSCKDTFESYDCANLRDCKFCTNMLMGASDCYDVNIWGDNLSLAYNSAGIGAGGQNIIGSYYIAFNARNVFHSIFCLNSVSDLFGCVGLQHKQYCILNKQYTEQEYKELLAKVIVQLKKENIWSKFFPSSLSAFGYNETVADEYYPLKKEETLARGFKWHDPDPKEYQKQTYQISENIKDVPEEIMNQILACISCAKNFKINLQELNFYKKKIIPIPRKCPDCRHKDRLALRNPRKLFNRQCAKCKIEIQTTYSPDRSETVYCEKCYLEEAR